MVLSDAARQRQARMTIRRYASAAEADRHDLETWMQIAPAERVLQAWRLRQELWLLAGRPPDPQEGQSFPPVIRRTRR
jgi:hypothetical protein